MRLIGLVNEVFIGAVEIVVIFLPEKESFEALSTFFFGLFEELLKKIILGQRRPTQVCLWVADKHFLTI
jgi:hypothetical protein